MKVVLAGYNVESELVEEAGGRLGIEFTPEVISAAYARISRDPRNVTALRKEARTQVGKSRKSNETIVFGLGHSSIAEHAVFNFDVMGVSRLAVEAIEQFRLASFTEKSQRYIKLGRDNLLPGEVKGSILENDFRELLVELTDAYEKLYHAIVSSGEDAGVAKEDARYLMPLATTSQLGMTINARELEYMISRLASHPLEELRRFSSKLSKIAAKKAPSLVKYHAATEYFEQIARSGYETGVAAPSPGRTGRKTVVLVDHTADGDIMLAAALLFSGGGIPFRKALDAARRMRGRELRKLVQGTMEGMKSHDGVRREFETINMLFELAVSSSCYAQLKRHRMTTQIVQPYSTALGVSMPESVRKAGATGIFLEAVGKSEHVHAKLKKLDPRVSEYALTNAHRRKVLLGINLRELYHFSRLRSDRHAQWEIRGISEEMCSLAAGAYPAAAALLGGKDEFDRLKKELKP
ncbi:MAG: FAD-dependent thymidylate synthase [Candidatus Krumholzibacteria bacterium]|nr:FAD-dependent thymidylate synthase [Candidatus Krumholzibacteria bacterium]